MRSKSARVPARQRVQSLSGPATSYTAAFVTTLILSWMSFRTVEKPMIRVGQRVGMAMRRLIAERTQLRDLNRTTL